MSVRHDGNSKKCFLFYLPVKNNFFAIALFIPGR